MKNLNTKNLLAASVAALISVNTFAVVPDDVADTVVVEFQHPQSIAVSQPNNNMGTGSGEVSSTKWTITSNNAVKLQFTGTSLAADGTTQQIPEFAKQEVDARGEVIGSAYYHLTTTFGVKLENQGSVETGDTNTTWGNSIAPNGTPTLLVGSGATGASDTFKAIMPNDNGTFDVTLYSKGVGDTSTTQSGNYQVTVITTLVADEKLNP
ncbi:hypothetical protein [Candidatus Thioglobus sp.]|uniref:hypothetical protein n=1 Tax=Candidatus Thioglobus sp. TaxID=2026721 RepID=UPI001776F219|nr:hypothetical protein [Candidatus Thioglobus sp.]HIF47152.1 hypothetical protein [Candidatus Thioglobus sp.]